MNILFLSAHYPPSTRGGGEISTHLIAQGLAKRGHSVRVVTTGDTAGERSIDGITVQHVPLPLTAKPLFERFHARKIARAFARLIKDIDQYDVIHAHDFRSTQFLSELIGARKVLAERCFVTARDYAQICGSPTGLLTDGTMCAPCNSLNTVRKLSPVVEGPLWRRPFRIWQYWYNTAYRLAAFKSIPNHVYISQAQLDHIARVQEFSGIRTTVIYNPVAPSFLIDPPREVTNKELLYLGTLASYKGVEVLLEAFSLLAQEDDAVRLTFVGEGERRQFYESIVDQRGLQYRVAFKPQVVYSEVSALYDAAHIVIAPHLWIEPFGRTVVEAMAREKIVITSDIGGPAEVVQNGRTGYLVQPNDPIALKDALVEALVMSLHERRAMQREARKWIAENISQEHVAQRYEQFYS